MFLLAVSVWSEAGEEHFSSVSPCWEGGSVPFSGCTETLWAGAVQAAAVESALKSSFEERAQVVELQTYHGNLL